MNKEEPVVKKPQEVVKGGAVDHIRITDKKTKKELVNKRG